MIRWLNATKWTKEAVERLPEHYRKFRMALETDPRTPVHYKPEEHYQVVNGEVKRFENVPIQLKFPKESHTGLWGGEALIKGFKKKALKKRRVAHWWFPRLRRTVVYSEILDEYMEVNVTERTLSLIDDHAGFDAYILKTRACDLQSQLALDIRRKMLLALVRKDLYPNNAVKRKEIIEKYKEHIIPEEEAEWWGLSFHSALLKQKEVEENRQPIPFKEIYRAQLYAKLREEKDTAAANPDPDPSISTKPGLLDKINIFKKKPEERK